MLGTYEDCQRLSNSRMCANCQHDSLLVVRHVAGGPGPGDQWEVLCPRCEERSRFVKPESLTAQWRRDPGSVNIAIANKLEAKYGGNPMTEQGLTVITKKEMIERIDGARWAHQLTPAQVLTVAEIAVRYGYDPLMGEVTVYEGKIYVTLDGALRDAKRIPNFQGIQTTPLTEQEREGRGIKQPIAYRCELYRADWKVPAVGIGVADPAQPFRNNPVERTQPHALAEARAIRRAVRLAREVPTGIIRQDIDMETGEILAAVQAEPAVEAESVRVAPTEVVAEPAANGTSQAKEGTLTKCADCDKPILGHHGKTKFWAAEELIDLSTETYDRALCYGCSLKAKAAKTEAKVT
jgi:hypothetical protein